MNIEVWIQTSVKDNVTWVFLTSRQPLPESAVSDFSVMASIIVLCCQPSEANH